MNKRKKVHEAFHAKTLAQKKIIPDNNFTYRLILQSLNTYLDGKKPMHILDIGCGAGTLAFYLASKGHKVTGVDISEGAIQTCKESAKQLGIIATFRTVDFPEKTPGGKYDLVLLTEVIEHLKDEKKALKKINELLVRGGMLFLTTPLSSAPLTRLGLTREFDKRVGHLRRYEKQELKELIRDEGFTIVKSQSTEGVVRNFLFVNPLAGKFVRFIKFFLSDWVTFVDDIFLKLFGASNMFIFARKHK